MDSLRVINKDSNISTLFLDVRMESMVKTAVAQQIHKTTKTWRATGVHHM